MKNIITSAACIYIELDKYSDLKNKCLSESCQISTDDLIKEGLLNKDDVDNYQVINIYKYNNEKICKIKED